MEVSASVGLLGSLARLERQLFDLETSYLLESPEANVVRGFDVRRTTAAPARGVREEDRVVSRSSVFSRPLTERRRGAAMTDDNGSSGGSGATAASTGLAATPSAPPKRRPNMCMAPSLEGLEGKDRRRERDRLRRLRNKERLKQERLLKGL